MFRIYKKYADRAEDGIDRPHGYAGHIGIVRAAFGYWWARLTKQHAQWTMIISDHEWDYHIIEWA